MNCVTEKQRNVDLQTNTTKPNTNLLKYFLSLNIGWFPLIASISIKNKDQSHNKCHNGYTILIFICLKKCYTISFNFVDIFESCLEKTNEE